MRRSILILLTVVGLVTAGVAPVVGTGPASTVSTPAQPAATAAANDDTTPATDAATQTNNTTTAESTTLTILSYNDVQTAAAQDGNLPRMATLIDRRRAAHDNPTVVVGGGDEVSPHALSPVSQWRAPVGALNVVGPDAEVVGNHDLDYGFGPVEEFAAASEFPWLAANLIDESDGEPIDGTEATHVVEKDGVKVGFVGLVDEAIKGKTAVDFDEAGVRVADFREVGPRLATELKEERNVDVVVALAHVGIPESRELANASENIDVVVVGDDEVVFPPREVSDTVVTEAGARAEFLGELNLTVEDGEVTSFDGRILEVTEDVPKDENVSAVINDFRAEVSLDSPVAVSKVPLDSRFATNFHVESGYGNLITDAMRNRTGADVAITNAGGIRSNQVYGPGPITGGDVFNTLPFANTVVVLRLSGADLREALASQVVPLESEGGQIFGAEPSQQVSGVRFEWVGHEGAQFVRDVWVNGERLDPDANYTVAVNSFIAGGGTGYPLADEPRVNRTGTLLATTVVEYMEARGTVAPRPEGRMQRVDRDLRDATVRLDGNGKVVLRFDAPADFDGTVPGTVEVSTKGNATVAAEHVAFDDAEDTLVVRFDDGALTRLVEGEDGSLVDGERAALDLYVGYDSTAFDRVFFEFSRLNADLTAVVDVPPGQQGDDRQSSENGRPARATPAVAAPS